MDDDKFHVWNKTLKRHEAFGIPLHRAAELVKLDPHEAAAMIEGHGRVDTDTHRIRPAKGPFKFAFLEGK